MLTAIAYPKRVFASSSAVPRPSQPAVSTAPSRYHERYRSSFQPAAAAIASHPAATP